MTERRCRTMFIALLFAGFGLGLVAAAMADVAEEALQEGERLYEAERYEDALQVLARATDAEDPEIAKRARAYLGLCHYQRNEVDQSIVWFQRALETDPQYLWALGSLAVVYLGWKGDYAEGMRCAERAEALYSRHPQLYYDMAGYHAQLHEEDLAFRYVDKALYYGYADVAYVSEDPDFDQVRSADQFQALLAHIDSVAEGSSLRDQAAQKREAGADEEAERLYRSSLQRYEEGLGPDSLVSTIVLDALGTLNVDAGQLDAGARLLEQALAIRTRVLGADHPDLAASYSSLGEAYLSMGEYDRAIDCHESALAIELRVLGPDHSDVSRTYHDLAICYYRGGEYDRAAGCSEKALAIQLKSAEPVDADVATEYNNLAAAYGNKGEYDRAIGYYEKALAIRRSIFGAEHADVAVTYSNLGVQYYRKGEYDRAIGYFRSSLETQLKLLGPADDWVAICYNNLSSAYGRKGDYEREIEYSEKALSIRLEAHGADHPDVAQSYNNLGAAYGSKGDYDREIEYYEKALAMWLKTLGPEHPDVGTGYNNLGQAYRRKGEYDRAIEYYEKALHLWTSALGQSHPHVATTLNNLGIAYGLKGEHERAFDYLEEALRRARESDDRTNALLAAKNLGMLALELGQYLEAKRALLDGIAVIEQARGQTGAGRAEFMSRNISLYYLSFQASAQVGDMAAAFETAEAMRARGFLDRLSLSVALSVEGVPEHVRCRMLALNDELEALAAERAAEIGKPESRQDSRGLLAMVNELEQKEKEFAELDQLLMSNSRYKELRKPALTQLDEACRTLGADEAILEYVLWEQERERQVWCLLLRSSGAELVALDQSFTFSDAVTGYREAVLAGTADREKLGGDLYEKLIGVLEEKLAGVRKLVIVPDGALAFLPFDSLRRDGNSPYLCERYEVCLAPSVSVLRAVESREYGERGGRWLGIGGARYSAGGLQAQRGRGVVVAEREVGEQAREYYAGRGPEGYYEALGIEWSDLPGTREEVLAIEQRVYGGRGTRVELGAQASEQLVKKLSASGELAQQRVVHLACHGRYDAEYPVYSAVVLSEVSGLLGGSSTEDGYLDVEEVALLELEADVVILSACETGLGKVVSGDGVVGLTRAFLVAGANGVGVSLWAVDDLATKEFMVRAYELAEEEGMSFAAAMTRTKCEFIRSRGFSDPYYWSAFVLYGR